MTDIPERKLKFVDRKGAEKYLAFRVCDWFDADAMAYKSGVEAQVQLGIWAHLAHQGAPLIFSERRDASEEASRLRKAARKYRDDLDRLRPSNIEGAS